MPFRKVTAVTESNFLTRQECGMMHECQRRRRALNSVLVNTFIALSLALIPLLPAVTLNKERENASLMETRADQSAIKQAVFVYKSARRSLPVAAQ